MIESPLHRRLAGIRHALVIGAGRSGQASAAALLDAGVEVVASDDRAEAPGLETLRERGAEVAPAGDVPALLDRVDLVVPSPGVPEGSPWITGAVDRGLPVWSDPELAWRLSGPFALVAITGTNGKTSVTQLVVAMLDASGTRAVAGGNIDPPLTAALADLRSHHMHEDPPSREDPADPNRRGAALEGELVVVAELSSFALRFCHELRPRVGVLLNLAPDHLDWHPSPEAYAAAKARLWQAQSAAGDHAVVNADDPVAVALARAHAPAEVVAFSGKSMPPGPGVGVAGGRLIARLAGAETVLLDLDDLPLHAPHHGANVAAAACAALLAGADPEGVAAAARAFRPGRHRLEVVAERDGVVYVDDSKATNPHAAAAALHAFDSIVWIAGGLAKGVELDVLGRELERVRHALLIGAAATALATVCDAAGVPWTHASSLQQAVTGAAEQARRGDTVLLAPACASFDMFRDYADRGDRFAQAVRTLAVTGAGRQVPGDVEVRGG